MWWIAATVTGAKIYVGLILDQYASCHEVKQFIHSFCCYKILWQIWLVTMMMMIMTMMIV